MEKGRKGRAGGLGGVFVELKYKQRYGHRTERSKDVHIGRFVEYKIHILYMQLMLVQARERGGQQISGVGGYVVQGGTR